MNFVIPVTFSFKGEFYITASSKNEAREHVEKHCGLVLGGNIHSSLNDEDVVWDFPTHPEKEIGKAVTISHPL
jgi:hypothetical protein